MKIKLALLLLSTCFTSTLFSQAKTNEIGLFIAPGTYAVKNDNSGLRFSNYNIGFGAFYQRGLSDHFVYRASFGGRYEVFNVVMNNPHYDKSNHRSFLIELIPVQVHYIFNPTNKLQAYIGLNIGVRKTFGVNATFTKEGETIFSTTFKNQPFEFFLSVLVGANYRVGEKLSLFLQPEYRPFIMERRIGFMHGLNIQVGLLYRF